jgi:hypothetical protein
MKVLFEETLRQLLKKVEQLDDQLLGFANIEYKLYNEFRIEPPSLLPDKTEITTGSEKYPARHASKGFSLGQKFYIALYAVPNVGSYDLFKRILKEKGYSWDRSCYLSDGKVYFKEFSTVEIIGNTQAIEKIKLKAKARFEEIGTMLTDFNTEAEAFNKSLSSKITTKINDEKGKRANKSKTEQLLNPFV